MEKEFVPFQEALALKEIGFDEPCFAFYQVEYHENSPIMVNDNDEYRITGFRTCKNSEIPSNYTSCPTYSQAFRWFREKHKLHGMHTHNSYMIEGEINGDFLRITKFSLKSYEEAELACLRKLIEIVKK